MKIKRFAMLGTVAAAFVAAHAAADVVTVAQVLPLEGSVELSTRATGEAAELYLRRVNDSGGVNGHTIKVVTVNASSDLDKAAQRTAEFMRKRHPLAWRLAFSSRAMTPCIAPPTLRPLHSDAYAWSAEV